MRLLRAEHGNRPAPTLRVDFSDNFRKVHGLTYGSAARGEELPFTCFAMSDSRLILAKVIHVRNADRCGRVAWRLSLDFCAIDELEIPLYTGAQKEKENGSVARR